MKLDDKYWIEGETHNWILMYESEVKINGKGEEYSSKDHWYFSKLSNCLSKYVEQNLKCCETINDVLVRLDNIEAVINKIKG